MIWIIGTVLFLILGVLVVSFVCYRMAFYAGKKEPKDPEKIEIPIGEIYEAFRPQMEQWVLETRALPCKKYTIRSFDGLTLHGTYYECAPGAPMELMFHGYRGSAQRDLPGGVSGALPWGEMSCWWISGAAETVKARPLPLVFTSTETAWPGWILR